MLHSGLWKRTFRLLETVIFYSELLFSYSGVGTFFKRTTLFLLVGTDFLTSRSLFFPFFRHSCEWKLSFVSWKSIFKRMCHSVWWRRTSCLVETLFSYLILFSTSGSRHWNWWPMFLGRTLNLLLERGFLYSGNCLFFCFFSNLFPASENRQ